MVSRSIECLLACLLACLPRPPGGRPRSFQPRPVNATRCNKEHPVNREKRKKEIIGDERREEEEEDNTADAETAAAASEK